jgi:hypothetical protein
VTDGDLEAVAAWRVRGAPTVGVEGDLELAPLCTFRLELSANGGETWVAAKVLRSEIMRVHLRIPADRWAERPASVPPQAWWPEPLGVEAAIGDLRSVWPVMIGHYPLSRATFSAAKPRFAGVATLEREELDGYQEWRTRKGGTFDSLAPVSSSGEPMPGVDPLTPVDV